MMPADWSIWHVTHCQERCSFSFIIYRGILKWLGISRFHPHQFIYNSQHFPPGVFLQLENWMLMSPAPLLLEKISSICYTAHLTTPLPPPPPHTHCPTWQTFFYDCQNQYLSSLPHPPSPFLPTVEGPVDIVLTYHPPPPHNPFSLAMLETQ